MGVQPRCCFTYRLNKLVLEKPVLLEISFTLSSVLRSSCVMAASVYSRIHSLAVLPEFFLHIMVRSSCRQMAKRFIWMRSMAGVSSCLTSPITTKSSSRQAQSRSTSAGFYTIHSSFSMCRCPYLPFFQQLSMAKIQLIFDIQCFICKTIGSFQDYIPITNALVPKWNAPCFQNSHNFAGETEQVI